MIPEFGQLCLILALCLAVAQAFFPLAGAQLGKPAWMAVAVPAAAGQMVFVLGAFATLAWSFVHNDFTVAYVAANSNSSLPAIYRFAAVWGGHEGSLLLWVLLLSFWTAAVAAFSRDLPRDLAAQDHRRHGLRQRGLHTVHPRDVQPVPAHAAGTAGWQ